MDGARLGLRTGSVDWVCSSHIVEHFERPEHHVAEIRRVLRPGGTAFIVTPNKPADFENPFHISLFEPHDLERLLKAHFDEVTLLGLDGTEPVKEDFAKRRRTGNHILAIDFLDLRHRIPRRWYIAGYSWSLRVVYRVLAKRFAGGTTGITAEDFRITEHIDPTTLVLFAIARVGVP
jgi:SAM-dependent methyltransferase